MILDVKFTSDIIDTLDNIISVGTEADEQLLFEKKNGMDNLLLFLMEDVEYNI